ncbi:hypothetical protein [Spirosoma spitsbergense]|nr:hypothetical protein [Spirosoma spitsbergense]
MKTSITTASLSIPTVKKVAILSAKQSVRKNANISSTTLLTTML